MKQRPVLMRLSLQQRRKTVNPEDRMAECSVFLSTEKKSQYPRPRCTHLSLFLIQRLCLRSHPPAFLFLEGPLHLLFLLIGMCFPFPPWQTLSPFSSYVSRPPRSFCFPLCCWPIRLTVFPDRSHIKGSTALLPATSCASLTVGSPAHLSKQ